MNTLPNNTFGLPTDEELHVLIRSAHAERSQVIRDMIAALFAWRRRVSDGHLALADGKAVPCH